MAAARIVEAVDVFEDCHLGLPPCFPRPSPDQLCLDGFEERLDGGIEAPIFVKERSELIWTRKAGCRFRERYSVSNSE